MILRVASLALAANTFILAWSDDGSSALLARRDGAVYSLELVSPKHEHAQQLTVTKDDCVPRAKRLLASLTALGFTGVEVRPKACAGPADTLVRTLKRHAELANASFTKERPPLPDPPQTDERYAVSPKLVLVFAPEKTGAILAHAYAHEGDVYRALPRN